MPQGHRGHVLRSHSNLVSTESGVRSADFEFGLISGPVQPPQVDYRLFRRFPLQVLRFFADLGRSTNRLQVQVSKQVNTG